MAIAVIVSKSSSGRPISQGHACFFRNIRKGSIAIVSIETIFSEICHVEIGPPIVIKVPYGHSKSPPVVRHSRFFRHVGKRAIVVVMKECGVRRSLFP